MKRYCILFLSLFITFGSLYGASADKEPKSDSQKKRVDVFVYTDSSITIPTNALRAELTHELVNNDSTYVVTDRSAEMLSFLRQELNYQESGMVRDDQLIRIGEHFGANYLCVIYITWYKEYNQYFFEGVLLDILTRTVEKHSFYPKEGNKVERLDPQTQINIGKDLARQFGFVKNNRAVEEARERYIQSAGSGTTAVVLNERVKCY